MTIDASDIRAMFAEQSSEARYDRVMNALEKATWIFLNLIAAITIVLAVVL